MLSIEKEFENENDGCVNIFYLLRNLKKMFTHFLKILLNFHITNRYYFHFIITILKIISF